MTSSARIPGLDAVRAIGVSAVIAYHLPATGAYVPGGYLGVTMFFVLSGYLITTLLLREAATSVASGASRVVAFYSRRIRRLLPAALLAALFTYAVGKATRGDLFAAALWHFNWHEIGTDRVYGAGAAGGQTANGLAHYWSLAIEEQFYLVWPIVMITATRMGARRRAQVAVLALTAASVVAALTIDSYLNTFSRASEILIGASAAVLLPASRSRRRWSSRTTALALVGLAALFAAANGPIANDLPYAAILTASALTLVLVVAPLRDDASTVGSRLLRWLGTRSYSLYLWHWPLILLLQNSAVVLVATALAGEVSYQTVERLRSAPSRTSFPILTTTGVVAAFAAIGVSPVTSLAVLSVPPSASAVTIPARADADTSAGGGSSPIGTSDTGTEAGTGTEARTETGTEAGTPTVPLPPHILYPGADDVTGGGTLLWLHGGGWVNGDPDLATQGAFAHGAIQFQQAGYTIVSLDFDRALDPSRRYAEILDAITAIDADESFVRPIVVAGYSSGGHLASWAATNWNAPGRTGARPDLAVNMSGALDPITWHPSTWDIIAPSNPRFVDVTVAVGPLGVVSDQADAADPPQILIHSTQDDITPFDGQTVEADRLALVVDVTRVPSSGGHDVTDVTDLVARAGAAMGE